MCKIACYERIMTFLEDFFFIFVTCMSFTVFSVSLKHKSKGHYENKKCENKASLLLS